ncbi:P27 family phage terminase small subunit [Fervidibacillus albus]|uniref:P27 family phage terminase small subunit n=1 Tax=Fervidibacillus albus TaxID=2980026 RepID=A0A9E8RWL9_9BACI|nr:P27 family phage terminase small subunit [Fervidibacillus albus]WAA10831.1 P27 family phage terminase small subunit [Fervidibacillus albus]
MARKSKVIIEAEEKRQKEEERIRKLLVEAEIYSPSLEPLIELYLDSFEVYHVKYGKWKKSNFPETKKSKNVNGDIKETIHPLKKEVLEWSSQLKSILGQLGLDYKGAKIKGKTSDHLDENEDSHIKNNKLIEFRRKFAK